jgi:hypothetical protein
MKNKPKYKLFIVRKYVKARDVSEACRLEKQHKPDDVWVDEEWKKGSNIQLADAIGFNAPQREEDEE